MFRTTIAAITLSLAGTSALAQENPGIGQAFRAVQYQVSITNLTPGQSFTPQFLATHSGNVRLFSLGEPASWELEQLAEGGATGPLADQLANFSEDMLTIDGLLGPGQTATATLRARAQRRYLSMAAMLLPTNDTFVAANAVALPASGSVTFMVPAYDAGTEENDQDCASIPGPLCGGEAVSDPAAGDEGFVHISSGFHDLGAGVLGPVPYDWRNPVARIVVTRVN